MTGIHFKHLFFQKHSRRGQLSVGMLFIATITVVLITGFIFLAMTFLQFSIRGLNSQSAFSIAEAGIEYYRWHLAHSPTDFQDGTSHAGPYVHNYYDKDGNVIGTFTLDITAPVNGSTVVTVKSTGIASADTSIQKVIEVKFAKASFAKYAVAANDNMRFGTGTEVFGEIFSNGGIRFDGLAHNKIYSAQSNYDDPDHGGQNEFGVHTHVSPVDPLPPASVPTRTDVFMAGRQFPSPAIDFSGMTQDLAGIKSKAQASSTYFASSTVLGYDLVFATSGIYSVYKITALAPAPNGCTNTSNQDGWGTWAIQSENLFATGTIPANGNFFFEDNLWVRGQIDGKRVTVAAGRFPDNAATRANITVNANLLYTRYDGADSIGLIAQNNFNVGLMSADVLRIDGALISQNGRVGRYYYQPPNNQANNNRCGSTVVRQSITLYGMIGSNQRYGFGYTDSTGYQDRFLIYDAQLLYAPPPSFPLTTSQYSQISWRQIQ
jgi:hypothetical protein